MKNKTNIILILLLVTTLLYSNDNKTNDYLLLDSKLDSIFESNKNEIEFQLNEIKDSLTIQSHNNVYQKIDAILVSTSYITGAFALIFTVFTGIIFVSIYYIGIQYNKVVKMQKETDLRLNEAKNETEKLFNQFSKEINIKKDVIYNKIDKTHDLIKKIRINKKNINEDYINKIKNINILVEKNKKNNQDYSLTQKKELNSIIKDINQRHESLISAKTEVIYAMTQKENDINKKIDVKHTNIKNLQQEIIKSVDQKINEINNKEKQIREELTLMEHDSRRAFLSTSLDLIKVVDTILDIIPFSEDNILNQKFREELFEHQSIIDIYKNIDLLHSLYRPLQNLLVKGSKKSIIHLDYLVKKLNSDIERERNNRNDIKRFNQIIELRDFAIHVKVSIKQRDI